MNKVQLVKKAIYAQKLSYSPYSHFKVGAALLTKDGTVHLGANIENPAYGATMCAERVALYGAYTHGATYKNIVAFAIVTDTKSVAKPCGICRQVMYELLPPTAKIYLANNDGKIEETTLDKLLPNVFTKKDLKKK